MRKNNVPFSARKSVRTVSDGRYYRVFSTERGIVLGWGEHGVATKHTLNIVPWQGSIILAMRKLFGT